jgi:hypothetical protein
VTGTPEVSSIISISTGGNSATCAARWSATTGSGRRSRLSRP